MDPNHDGVEVETSPHAPAIVTFDELLAELAMTYPLAGYAAAVDVADAESAFDHQILGGLVSP